MQSKITTLMHLVLSLFVLLLATPPANAQTNRAGKEVYRGNITYIGGPRGAVTDFFTLTINNITPEAEVTRLLDLLKRDGQDKFWDAVSKEKHGTIQIGSGLSRDLNAVWVTQTEDGRKISAVAERWLGFGELRRGARSVDYPFTYIELFVQEDGDVEGTLFPAARVRAKSGNTIEVENFGIYPARLVNIKRKKK
ncbi:MAG: hypothetical protein HYR56_31815 [Acidobacteria bacterium]|nr:hypothetical protein [Acidobacteriota bacterium]MBI3424281.1 hypothetical protein [Acidobacteriota bacterium]